MKAIARFYTLFWIIYFPTCLAFQSYDWSDELLCVILMGFGFLEWNRRRRNKRMEKEMVQYWVIIGFYTVYSLIIQVTTFRGIYLDFFQQIRPYMVFYMTFFMAPNFSNKQKKLLIGSMLLVMALFLIRGNTIEVYRAGGEEGVIGHVATTCAMIYFLFSKDTQKNKIIAIAIMLVALMSGKSKIFGQCIVFIGIVLFLKKKVSYRSPKMYVALAVLVTVVLYFSWAKFNSYYVEGMQEAQGSYVQARPASYKVAYGEIIWDYFPLGPGLGTFGTAAAAKEYSPLYHKYNMDEIWGLSPDNPMFLADCFFPTLAEFGIVGIILFCIFWRRRLLDIKRINDIKTYKMALIVIASLFINSTADSAYLSGMGMGFFMILAICLSSNRYLPDREEKKFVDKELETVENLEVNPTLSDKREEIIDIRHLRPDYWDFHKR